MSRARTATESVLAVIGLLLLSPVLLTCAAMAGVSLVWDEAWARWRVRQARRWAAGGRQR